MRPPVSLALASCIACTVPNPAFDLDTGTSANTSNPSTSDPTPTSPATTSEPTSEPTPSTTTPTTGSVDPNTTTGTSADITTSTSDTDDTTSDDTSDTGDPVSCWANGVDGWPVAGTELTKFLDAEARDPFITPDGLRMYYVAQSPQHPFVSTRPARNLPFPNGTPLVAWGNDPQYAAAHPALVLGETEMLLINNQDVAFSVYQPDQPDKYSKPVTLAGPTTGDSEEVVTATADGTLLIVSRLDGDPLPPFYLEKSPRFHQFTRANPKPGDAFSGGVNVTPELGTLHLAICPVISPDGLHLFFASTEAAIIMPNDADNLVSIYYTRRDSHDAPWGQILHVPIANGSHGVACPSSVTADGCELAYHQFHYLAPGYAMFLAARAP